MQATTVGAIVVAGGTGRRMGGVDKLLLEVDGSTLLDRVLRAARPLCRRLVVVGPPRPTGVAGVDFLQEERPGGGPAPAVLAGLATLGPVGTALVLAGDLPLLTTDTLARLVGALTEDAGNQVAAAPDERAAPNPLLAAYRPDALRRAAALGVGYGDPAARLLPARGVTLVDVSPSASLNVNEPADLRRAEAILAAADGDGADGRP